MIKFSQMALTSESKIKKKNQIEMMISYSYHLLLVSITAN